MEKTSSTFKSRLTNDHHSIWLTVGLHLLPGILATVVFIPSARFFWNNNLPTALALFLVLLVILIPFEYGVIRFLSKKKEAPSKNLGELMQFPSIIKNTQKTSTKTLMLLSFLALFWIVLIMGVVDKQLGVSTWIYDNWFQWLPEYFDITGVYNHPEQYSTGILVLVLSLSLFVGAIIGPFVEELYFRGFLLPRMANNTWIAPVLNAVLFASYHLWTPWMLPMRVLGLIPMIFLVWWKKDIKIGIYSHIALNLFGDVIMVIPIFFL